MVITTEYKRDECLFIINLYDEYSLEYPNWEDFKAEFINILMREWGVFTLVSTAMDKYSELKDYGNPICRNNGFKYCFLVFDAPLSLRECLTIVESDDFDLSMLRILKGDIRTYNIEMLGSDLFTEDYRMLTRFPIEYVFLGNDQCSLYWTQPHKLRLIIEQITVYKIILDETI